MSIFIDIVVSILIAIFLALMFWQMVSLLKIYWMTVDHNIMKLAAIVLTPVLSVLYINDVFSMMLFYWGAPSHKMTQ